MSEGDGEFVESGSFRVDRKRALAKLERYQLSVPEFGIYYWVRAAAASAAKRLDIEYESSCLRLRFDGKGFSKGTLADPYGGLFEGDDPARHALAAGLLWLVRSRAKPVSVSSRGGRLTIESLENDVFEPVSSAFKETVVEAKFYFDPLGSMIGGVLLPWQHRPKRTVEGYPAPSLSLMSGLTVTVNGENLSQDCFPTDSVVHAFEWRGARVRMICRTEPKSRVDLSAVGVVLESTLVEPRYAACWALAEFPGIALGASKFKAVKSVEYQDLFDRIGRQEKPLLEETLDAFESGVGGEHAGRCVGEACWRLLKSPESDGQDPLLRRLWDAAIIPCGKFGMRSLRKAVERPEFVSFEGIREKIRFKSLLGRIRRVP